MLPLAIPLPGRAIDPQSRFKHVMALALHPNGTEGVIRCITSREGSVDVAGFVDHSQLHAVHATGDHAFEIGERILIDNEDMIIGPLMKQGYEFLGLEDPDITVDEQGQLHVYFTIPIINRTTGENHIYLGHAEGESLSTLSMTPPVLARENETAKEVSLAPRASDGTYRHLIESSAPGTVHTAYSTVRVVETDSFDGEWVFGKTVLHPAERGIEWCGGHASPGPLLPDTFINLRPGLRVGFMNGREHDRVENEQVVFGAFTVGLFIYDYEKGEITWVSPRPHIQDTEAKTITFASQFVQTSEGEGILYAHVDDSFVRAYMISADAIRAQLP